MVATSGVVVSAVADDRVSHVGHPATVDLDAIPVIWRRRAGIPIAVAVPTVGVIPGRGEHHLGLRRAVHVQHATDRKDAVRLLHLDDSSCLNRQRHPRVHRQARQHVWQGRVLGPGAADGHIAPNADAIVGVPRGRIVTPGRKARGIHVRGIARIVRQHVAGDDRRRALHANAIARVVPHYAVREGHVGTLDIDAAVIGGRRVACVLDHCVAQRRAAARACQVNAIPIPSRRGALIRGEEDPLVGTSLCIQDTVHAQARAGCKDNHRAGCHGQRHPGAHRHVARRLVHLPGGPRRVAGDGPAHGHRRGRHGQ